MNQEFIAKKIKALHNFLQEQNRKTLVVGISGGIDSAVVLGLLKELDNTFPNTYTIVPMLCPIRESKGTTDQREAWNLGYEVISHFGMSENTYDLTSISQATSESFCIDTPYVQQQVDYWFRPMAFYYMATTHENSLIVTTTNKSEWELGWFSQYLDIFGVHPIIDLYKSDVYKLAKYFNIPESVINTAPKGGLATGETDEEALGFTYHEFEMYFRFGINTMHSKEIQKRIDESVFKRNRFNMSFIQSCS